MLKVIKRKSLKSGMVRIQNYRNFSLFPNYFQNRRTRRTGKQKTPEEIPGFVK
jgi:hypothetical protein